MLDLSAVPAPLTAAAQRAWEQFESNRQARQLPGLEDALGTGVDKVEFARQLGLAFAASEYLAKICAAKPEYLINLVMSGELFRPQLPQNLESMAHLLGAAQNEAEFDRLLRQERQRAMVRIIWRDFNRLANMQATTGELSYFAEAAIQQAATYHYRELEKLYGTPVGQESGKAQPFMVLGMGKLGARELNLSSDIDLIFTYPEGGETNHHVRSLSNQEFFVKLGQKLIKSLDATTADGFVFRTDMRLRPHGQSGPLVLSFAGMEDYYQTQGREWERYAMIKARRVAFAYGQTGDETYAESVRKQLRTLLAPFTYRQYIDFGAIESLREMKGLIARQVQRKGMSLDVKLGEGGIREVEFVVQVFQLIRGGRDTRLRQRQVTKLLPFLEQEGYLPEGAGSALLEAYVFLRNTEHALQGYQDRQTQSLPTDDLGRLRLAWVMGFADWPAFATALDAYRQRVNQEFKAVIAEPKARDTVNTHALGLWKTVWEGSIQSALMTPEEAQQMLGDYALEDLTNLLKQMQLLRESRALMSMQTGSRGRVDTFVTRLLLMLAEQDESGELPVSMGEAFSRIRPLIESVARRSAYLVLLIENPTALQQLVKLCAASPWIADQLARYPALLDELLTPESLYFSANNDHEAIKSSLRDELRRDVLRLAWDDLEGHMEALRYFRSAFGLRVAASEVGGTLPLMKVSDYLTFTAEVILEHVLHLAWEYMVVRHGRPKRADGSVEETPNFIIVGYGKLGGIELGHGSDLDLVFVHDSDTSLQTDGEKSLDNVTFYVRLGQRIIHILNTQTQSGKLYEVDMRLRPSGNSGMLVTTLAAFQRYQEKEAWTWEHQALVRARAVAGDELLAEKFSQVRLAILQQPRDLEALRKDVSDMRRKMREQLSSSSKAKSAKPGDANPEIFHLKQDAGGIVDIEFMVQYAALAWAHQSPEIVQYTDNIRILGSLEEAGLLDAASVAQLIAAYKAYRSTGHRLALQQQEAVLAGDHHFDVEREQVTRLWHQLIDVE